MNGPLSKFYSHLKKAALFAALPIISRYLPMLFCESVQPPTPRRSFRFLFWLFRAVNFLKFPRPLSKSWRRCRNEVLIRYGNGANQSSSHQPGVVRLEAEVGGVQDGE